MCIMRIKNIFDYYNSKLNANVCTCSMQSLSDAKTVFLESLTISGKSFLIIAQ